MSELRPDEEPVEASFQSFVDMLTDSETYQEFSEARHALEDDPVALELLEEYQTKQRQMEQEGFEPSLLSELRDLKSEMAENETIQRHQDAQEALIKLLRETNDVISEQLGREFAQSTGGGCC